MMKKISLLLAVMMLLSAIGVPALAEDAIRESASGFYYVAATDTQAALSAKDKALLIQADGLYFKDLNKNGKLDVYEDWRADVEARVDDLLGQMTIQEKAGSLFYSGILGSIAHTVTDYRSDEEKAAGPAKVPYLDDEQTALYSHNVVENIEGVNVSPMVWQIQDMSVTTFITDLTGNPKDQVDMFNKLQAISEGHRLGIPSEFSSNRSYITWGGMIDMPHYAFGVAHDEELLFNLVTEYAREASALGLHQVLHGYGNEIGSWYGDEVNYLSQMSVAETRAYDQFGFSSHSKHYIARGGRSAFNAAKSPADLWESYMVGWKAVVDAGTTWIMSNNNVGLTPGVQAYMDKVTYDYLRNDLGYDGLVVLDWPAGIKRIMSQTGITADGVDISTLTAQERYALILNAGVDMFSALGVTPGLDVNAYPEIGNAGMPDVLVDAVQQGLVSEDVFHTHVRRVLRHKFNIGIFEDPYSDWETVLKLIGNETYQADASIVPMTNDEIDALRRPEITAMEQELMVKSTIMLKNDGILPLKEGVKLYLQSNNENILNADREALGVKGKIVETVAEADAVLIHVTAFNEIFDYAVEDAQAAGKPVILIFEGTIGRNGAQGDPYGAQVEVSSAVLVQTYNNTPDHGASVGSFYRYVKPSITADMLFGDKDPAGSTVFEVPYAAEDLNVSWKDLQHDVGVDKDVRLYMAMLAKDNPNILMPNNLGDVLYTTNFGMSYANPAAIELSLLTVDKTAVTTVGSNGRASTTVQNAIQKAGAPFEISFVAKNNGGDGHITVQVKDGDAVIAEKFVAVDGNAWRVINIELTLEAGEHVISIGDMVETIVVE